jgi:hypothetical protein
MAAQDEAKVASHGNATVEVVHGSDPVVLSRSSAEETVPKMEVAPLVLHAYRVGDGMDLPLEVVDGMQGIHQA